MAEIDFESITTGSVSGTGVFDELMRSVKAHLKEEYDSQRIRGSEYTQVYLGSLQSAMQQAIQWDLSAQIALNQAELIAVQKEGQEKQNLLLEEQRLLLIAQTALVNEQVLTQIEQTALTAQQGANALSENDSIVAQTAQIEAQTENLGYQDQVLIQDALLKTYQHSDLVPTQKAKLDAEIKVLDQKFITEESQTKTITSQGTMSGMLGAQRDLYIKQTDGFDRDAEQKATRIVTDVWGVLASTTEGVEGPNAVSKTQLDETLLDLKTKAGLD